MTIIKEKNALRLALFLDVQSFYIGLYKSYPDAHVDLAKLVDWLQYRAKAGFGVGTHCYMDEVFYDDDELTPFQRNLESFFSHIKKQPAVFSYFFPQEFEYITCDHCQTDNLSPVRRELHIAVASHMIQLAHSDAYDRAVLISDHAEYSHVLKSLQWMGKQIYVANWGKVAPDLKAASFQCIDLNRGLGNFVITQEQPGNN